MKLDLMLAAAFFAPFALCYGIVWLVNRIKAKKKCA